MGTGKTLPWIEAAEHVIDNFVDFHNYLPTYAIWYVGPRSGVKAVNLELKKWKAKFIPKMMTYEQMIKEVANLISVPIFVFFDESSKLKNESAQRTQAAMELASRVRNQWPGWGHILEATGTPAPKSPIDWYSQAEVACPGFLKEGDTRKFKKTLCLVIDNESFDGSKYPVVKTWWDNPNKCAICGEFEDHFNHTAIIPGEHGSHQFQPSVNEVERLYRRLKGLVLIKFKKDCIELPEKQYQVIEVEPSADIKRYARLAAKTGRTAIQRLTLLRELSDGFQYVEEPGATEVCPNCNGSKIEVVKIPEFDTMGPMPDNPTYREETCKCSYCDGTGVVQKIVRGTVEIGTPKDQILLDELDEHDDIGRYVVWAGFTGTIERLVKIVTKAGWNSLRIDGKGYIGTGPDGKAVDADDLLKAMDASHPDFEALKIQYPKVCVVGNPDAGGMGLTFTASPCALFFSNSFKGESRMQAEDRIHRLGMPENRGCIIKDIVMLPTDKLIIENLKKKKQLQALSLGDLETAMGQESLR
jgi:SNF2 family DNA or RNA helicase